MNLQSSRITCAAATFDLFAVGREDGFASCFSKDHDVYHLRDKTTPTEGEGQLPRSSVKDLVLVESHGRKLVYVLQLDGNLEVWDIQRSRKLYSQSLGDLGTTPSRLWVGPYDIDSYSIPMAILHKQCSLVESSKRSTSKSDQKLLTFLQENFESTCTIRALESCRTLEWVIDGDDKILICLGCQIAVRENCHGGIKFRDIRTSCRPSEAMKGEYPEAQTLRYVNWEFNGSFNVPHRKQREKFCWLYALTDQLEGQFHTLNPSSKPIRISKQFIIDYIPVEERRMGKEFPYPLSKAYQWALDNDLVLEENYADFTGIKEPKRPIRHGPRLKISDLTRLEVSEQDLVDNALSKYPIACTIFGNEKDIKRLNRNPGFPYVISEDTPKKRSHAVVLSGRLTYTPTGSLDSFLVKDPACNGEMGRFFLKKKSALQHGEANPIGYVIYPKTIILTNV